MAEAAREEGNGFFRSKKYFRANASYIKAIRLCPPDDHKQLAIIYCNISATQLILEKTAEAIASANEAIDLDNTNIKGYVRRANVLVHLLDWKGAYDDFLAAAKIEPQNQILRKKMEFCKQQLLSGKLREVLSAEGSDDETSGGEIPIFNEEFAKKVMEDMSNDIRPSAAVLKAMVRKMRSIFQPMKNIVDLTCAKTIQVVGDTHGQFQDVLHIFKTYGFPSTENPYIFNGDFVDRGSMGIEILITLFAWKLANPDCIHMNRGNHEAKAMNSMYGFERECKAKYSKKAFKAISELFNMMPLGHIINGKVLIVHGGLFQDESITIDAIQGMDRFNQPPESGPLNDILWSDPMEEEGFAPSKRGGTQNFGPDVTERFLKRNNLELLIRSHQLQENGYSVMHDGKCITVFSAPNYIGQMGNMGAICKLTFTDGVLEPPEFQQFTAQPIPAKYKPMCYAPITNFF